MMLTAVCVVRRISLLAIAFAVSICGAAAAQGQSKSLSESTSLSFVNEDVAFYTTSLRLKEQMDVFLNSRAFDKIKNHPIVQMGIGQVMSEWESPSSPQVGMAKGLLSMPENQQLVAMLQDAVSNEVFMIGDENMQNSLKLLMEISQQSNDLQMAGVIGGQEAMKEKVLDLLERVASKFAMPGMMIGMKLTDKSLAVQQLKRLEDSVTPLLKQLPPDLAKRFSRSKIGQGDFITISLDGSLVPWQQIPMDEFEDVERKRVEALIAKAKTMTATISLGLIDDYLVFAIGESTEPLEKHGTGKLLIDRKEMAPLKQFMDKPVTSIAYLSETTMKVLTDPSSQLNSAADTFQSLIELAGDDLSEEIRAEIDADLDDLVEDLKGFYQQPGAIATIGWIKPTGYEGYSYNYSKSALALPQKKMSVLNHVGQSPLFVGAGNNFFKPADYDMLVKWFKRGQYYLEQIGQKDLSDDEREQYEQFKTTFTPLFKRFDSNIRDNMFPAFNGGEFAIILDGKAKSNSWHAAMPPADQELSLPELAMVWGITDANKVEQSFATLFEIFDDGITGWNKVMTEDQLPIESFPRPEQTEIASGTLYSYTLPADVGLNERISPNWGLSPKTFVMSLLPEATKRLLPASTPSVFFGPLEDTKRPLVGAGYMNFAGMVEMVMPWIDYGVMTFTQGQDPDEAAQTSQMIMTNVTFVGEILSCFKGVSAAVYHEGDATVTHSESLFEDLP